jgi:hypothetical protein
VSRDACRNIVRIITLTKHTQNIVGSDVPPQGGTGAPEVRITAEMVDVGVCVIRERNYDFWETTTRESKNALVAEIFSAMVKASNRTT